MVGARATVLMPVYNSERFLSEAIQSILSQSFTPFEFLIIDDASTDRSIEIIESFRDPRIRFVRNPRHLGITATLNKGIALASCELIARMDPCNISRPQRLQKQFAFMKRNPDCALLSTWTGVLSENHKVVSSEHYRSNFYYYNLTFECWIHHSTVMFRKSAVEQVGMYAVPYAWDHDLFWRMSTRFRIHNLSEVLVDCRSDDHDTVLEKDEYDAANEQVAIRNILYYLGHNWQVSHAALQCLCHNFKPLLGNYKAETVVEALAVLDAVTLAISEKENVNRDPRSIRSARYVKRRFILYELGKALPLTQSIDLLIRSRAWITLGQILKMFASCQLKQGLKTFRSHRTAVKFRIFSSAVKNS